MHSEDTAAIWTDDARDVVLLDRREIIRRGVVLGLSTAAIGELLAACRAGPKSPSAVAVVGMTNTVTPGATAATQPSTTSPSSPVAAHPGTNPAGADQGVGSASMGPFGEGGGLGPGPARRGGGGTLKVLSWQAPTTLNPHLSQGINNLDITRLCYEPLADFDAQDRLVPWLAIRIPSVINGDLASDGRSVVWHLRQNARWSDGVPFTAADVVFTWRYATDPATGALSRGAFNAVAAVEAIDDTTVRVVFSAPTPGWYVPFTGPRGLILPEHIFREGAGARAKTFAANLNPVGTGPYRAVAFAPGDQGSFVLNPQWRDPNGPHYDRIEWKGGGDAVSAARAVLQTGDYHLGLNLQVEAAILRQLTGIATKGQLGSKPAFAVELLFLNFTDPNREIDGERASIRAPHPFLTDLAVRRAFALAIDRATIADSLYGPAAEPTAAYLAAPATLIPPDLTWAFDLDEASGQLDAARWVRQGQYRAKDGIPMGVLLQTTVNALRQKEQEIIKDALERIGIRVELKSIDAGVFLSADPGNSDTVTRFQADLELYTTGPDSPDLQAYLDSWTSAQVPNKANGWSTSNLGRYRNPAYDALLTAARTEVDPARRREQFLEAQRQLHTDVATIGVVVRKTPFAYATGIGGIAPTSWASITWNIANWTGP